MHQYLEDFLIASDQHEIPYRAWLAREPVASVLIAHGISEHAQRYEEFAEYLTEHGINVWAVEHRGHGEHCEPEHLGHYADQDGWHKVVSDVNQLKCHIKNTSRDMPLTLLGHSMGSYIAMAAVMAEGEGCDGLLLTGSGLNSSLLLRFGIMVATLEKLRLGARGISHLVNVLPFKNFNRYFKPNRSEFDWLSRDNTQVDKYLADPLCGFPCSNQLWIDFLRGQIGLSRMKNVQPLPPDLPVYLVSGKKDPVGFFGAGVRKLASLMTASGVRQVEVTLINDARHEVINETNANEVWEMLRQWIQTVSIRK
ncbi:alpha/beta fold hydrolase [Gynuella sp.]|uniref:alpha/beta fold hydrolase n=1 Tax=Gynuella sp. TaxID=2969146 RepID=UPI003D14E848